MSGFSLTYSIATQDGKARIATIIFDSEDEAQLSDVDYYDDCREKIQDWLDKHYPGERLGDNGDDIEADGSVADNDDVIDMRSS